MESFAINCTTCKSTLRVRDASLIGQILNCPKCGSMVMVEAPEGVEVATSAKSEEDIHTQETVDDISRSQAIPTATQGATPPKAKPIARPIAKSTSSEVESSEDEDDPSYLPTADWESTTARKAKQRLFIMLASTAVTVLVLTMAYLISGRGNAGREDDSQAGLALTNNENVGEQGNEEPETNGNAENDQEANEHKEPGQEPNGVDKAGTPDTGTDSKEPTTKENHGTDIQGSEKQGTETQTTENKSDDPKTPKESGTASGVGGNPPGLEKTDEGASASELKEQLQTYGDFLSNSPVEQDAELRPLQAPRIPIPRPAPTKVRVEDQLKFSFEGLQFEKVELLKLMRLTSGMTTIPITWDVDALASRGFPFRKTLALDIKNGTADNIFTNALQGFELGHEVSDGHVVISFRNKQDVEQTYAVADLLATEGFDAQALSQIIQTIVAPQSWTEVGSNHSITFEGTNMKVSQLPRVQYQIGLLCDKLRLARELAVAKDRLYSVTLDTVSEQAAPVLRKKVNAKFRVDTPITAVLKHLEDNTGSTFIVNWKAAERVGWGTDATATIDTTDRTVAETLGVLLEPMDLTYRALNKNTFEITTWEQMEQRIELELYSVGAIIGQDGKPELLINYLKNAIAKNSQRRPDQRWAVQYDPASKHLIVALPQPQQVMLHKILTGLKR